jgi:hypothetical protein
METKNFSIKEYADYISHLLIGNDTRGMANLVYDAIYSAVIVHQARNNSLEVAMESFPETNTDYKARYLELSTQYAKICDELKCAEEELKFIKDNYALKERD